MDNYLYESLRDILFNLAQFDWESMTGFLTPMLENFVSKERL